MVRPSKGITGGRVSLVSLGAGISASVPESEDHFQYIGYEEENDTIHLTYVLYNSIKRKRKGIPVYLKSFPVVEEEQILLEKLADGYLCVSPAWLLPSRLLLWYSSYRTGEVDPQKGYQDGGVDALLHLLSTRRHDSTALVLVDKDLVRAHQQQYPGTAYLWSQVNWSSDIVQNTKELPIVPSLKSAPTPPSFERSPTPSLHSQERLSPPLKSNTSTKKTNHEERIAYDPVTATFKAAQRVIELLASIGFDAAIYGGLASFMYGSTQNPTVSCS
jgi:hypothetical protein